MVGERRELNKMASGDRRAGEQPLSPPSSPPSHTQRKRRHGSPGSKNSPSAEIKQKEGRSPCSASPELTATQTDGIKGHERPHLSCRLRAGI